MFLARFENFLGGRILYVSSTHRHRMSTTKILKSIHGRLEKFPEGTYMFREVTINAWVRPKKNIICDQTGGLTFMFRRSSPPAWPWMSGDTTPFHVTYRVQQTLNLEIHEYLQKDHRLRRAIWKIIEIRIPEKKIRKVCEDSGDHENHTQIYFYRIYFKMNLRHVREIV